MKRSPLAAVRQRIRENRHCRLPDLLRRERVVMVEHGPMSHGGAPELVALLSLHRGFWYGHVVKVAPEEVVPEARDRGQWVSIIVQAFGDVDGHTPEEILENYRHELTERLNYQPCYTLHPDDTFRLSPTFEQACMALADMAAAFDPLLALGPNDDPYDDRSEHPRAREARLDMRCFDLYGLRSHLCGNDPYGPGGPFYQCFAADGEDRGDAGTPPDEEETNQGSKQ